MNVSGCKQLNVFGAGTCGKAILSNKPEDGLCFQHWMEYVALKHAREKRDREISDPAYWKKHDRNTKRLEWVMAFTSLGLCWWVSGPVVTLLVSILSVLLFMAARQK